jgi:cytochrome P450 family 6
MRLTMLVKTLFFSDCIGSRFGYLQIKIALVKLLTNFDFKINEKTLIPMKFNTKAPFLRPDGGMWLDIERLE